MDRFENSTLFDFPVSGFALGCWPIAGVTSVNVNEVDSRATIQAALDCGINFFDTAFGYGSEGESECLLGNVLQNKNDCICIATKCGMQLSGDGTKVFDCRPETIVKQCEESLRRLKRESIELLYLHAYDQKTPISLVAECFGNLISSGKVQKIGVCNLPVELLEEFHQVCQISVVQDYFNALQQGDRLAVRQWCQKQTDSGKKVHFAGYWPLMKGLLAGELKHNHVFHPKDSRQSYPMFQGDQWRANQDFLDQVRIIAKDHCTTVPGIVLAWTKRQIDFVLFGAKRPLQVIQNFCHSQTKETFEAIPKFEKALLQRLHN